MKKIKLAAIFVLPVLFFIAGNNFNRAKYSNDPEYIYLINALNICQGKGVGHIDNPGITVMESGAVICSISHFFIDYPAQNLTNSILSNPDKYIQSIKLIWLIINSLIIFLIGWVALQKSGIPGAPILLQLSSFFSINMLEHLWTKVSPEPVLFFITSILVIALLYFYSDKNKKRFCYLWVFSLIAGFGLATKATFLPLVIIPLFLLEGFKGKSVYLAFTTIFFVVFTLPAIALYKEMYYWFNGLLTHTGTYGQGSKGIINFNTYFPTVFTIVKANYFLSVSVGFGILALLAKYINPGSKNVNSPESFWAFRILAALITAVIAGILLVAKHYHANHYLLPELALSGAIIYFGLLNLILKFEITQRTVNNIMVALMISLFIIIPYNNLTTLKAKNQAYLATNQESDSIHKFIETSYHEHIKIAYYPYSLNKMSALNFGNIYSKKAQQAFLRTLHPETYFYNFYEGKFSFWNVDMAFDDIIKTSGNKILLIGVPSNPEKFVELKNSGITFKKVFSGNFQSVYEFDTIGYKFIQASYGEGVVFDAETLSTDRKYLLASNGEIFGLINERSDETSNAGKYSIKLDKNLSYALDYKIKNIKPGDKYLLKIWRFSENMDGHLVVSATNSSVFYQAQNEYISTNEKGWKLIQLKITLPDDFTEQELKVYLWNKGKTTLFFDDFSIEKELQPLAEQAK